MKIHISFKFLEGPWGGGNQFLKALRDYFRKKGVYSERAQKISDGEHQKRYSEAVREARLAGDKEFQSWFNKSKGTYQTIVRGYWDLTFHILTPKVCEYLEKPEEKVALEIGYGGGENSKCRM